MTSSVAGASGGASGSGAGKNVKSGGTAISQPDSSLKRKRGLFSKDLRLMMYGFGDDPDPMPETVSLVEDILLDYITDTIHKAQDVAVRRGKLATEDVMFLVRKDARKFARVKELLAMNEELKRARKAFEVDEEKFANEE
ncbi:transcription initiation factor TFIID subunit 13 [Marchantia polymorpha subsp. ruderalis]|uniref:Transcription initiation factor TFIID subunit 13 n=2 Tax=Marchantia polymorpha TaxID=3197 RepID=A0AAF6B4W1_MARPO|nr:hypothetical protein MARPO_0066s0092 [Marchantia polymorpha]BBN07045.1 hypothetical protein Mp_4g00490 [Marchantia polymorpha subsp. ruderalis]|eukprot:PTQ36139.1 hypothetical protein MARPO_0066s0092 [Marchantia polymorpha]